MSLTTHHRIGRRLLALAMALIVATGASLVTAGPASATQTCTAGTDCGYSSHMNTQYWNMTAGNNCTNYVAYRFYNRGVTARPWLHNGNAKDWVAGATSKGYSVDHVPVVGSVAVWGANVGLGGTYGHVAYVEKVNSSAHTVVISQYGIGSGFSTKTVSYSTSSTSWPRFIHIPTPFAAKATPTISGATAYEATLTAATGTWSPAPDFTYQWKRDGVAIANATSTKYTVAKADIDTDVTVTVTATEATFTTTSLTSKPAHIDPRYTFGARTASITGQAQAGKVLTANYTLDGVLSDELTFAFQWYVDGVAVKSGGAGKTFTVPSADVGKKVSVKVSFFKTDYRDASATSAQTAAVTAFVAP